MKLPSHFEWIIYAVLGGIGLYVTYPYLRRLVRFKPYNVGEIDWNKPEVRKLATGCHMNAQCYLRWDTLRSGDSPRFDGLRSWWGIRDRGSAIEVLNWLRDEGHRADWQDTVLHHAQYVGEDVDETLAHAEKFLLKHGLIKSRADFQAGVSAWDWGRLVTLSRWCYDRKYITEAEAWQYINHATQQSRAGFSSWETYSQSYMIGQFLWNPDPSENEPMVTFVKDLLKSEKSPLKRIRW